MELLARLLSAQEAIRRSRAILATTALLLLMAFAIGLFVLATSPGGSVTPTSAYTSGLSMILLPSTLPALLIILPMSLRKGYRKGFLMVLLFGLGLTVTAGLYGTITAYEGRVLYLDRMTLLMWLMAGAVAYLLGLSELDLLPGRPSPSAERRRDYPAALLLGLLLGNAGISCPNPAFYRLLSAIARSGAPGTGLLLGLLHGMGRATPLLALSSLAILGVTATGWLRAKSQGLQKAVGWSLIGLASLLLPKPLIGLDWWEEFVLHTVWNRGVDLLLGQEIAESRLIQARLGYVPAHDPWALYAPWASLAILLLLPLLWASWRSWRSGKPVPLDLPVEVPEADP